MIQYVSQGKKICFESYILLYLHVRIISLSSMHQINLHMYQEVDKYILLSHIIYTDKHDVLEIMINLLEV